jgi:hypothetical protein
MLDEIAETISVNLLWGGKTYDIDGVNVSTEAIPPECDYNGPRIYIRYVIGETFLTKFDGTDADETNAEGPQWNLEIDGDLRRTTGTCNGWQFSLSVLLAPQPNGPTNWYANFDMIGEVPVDEEGYPSGTAHMRHTGELPGADGEPWFIVQDSFPPWSLGEPPVYFPKWITRSITVEFSRDLS